MILQRAQNNLIDAPQIFASTDGAGDLVQQIQLLQLLTDFVFGQRSLGVATPQQRGVRPDQAAKHNHIHECKQGNTRFRAVPSGALPLQAQPAGDERDEQSCGDEPSCDCSSGTMVREQ